ncbi:hypothetical protein GCM10027048_18620 [Hymenobacter coalescens]
MKGSGQDTGGALAVFEQISRSQGRGTPLHVHPGQDDDAQQLEMLRRGIEAQKRVTEENRLRAQSCRA